MGRTPPAILDEVEAVCFDLDNTLIDIVRLKRRAAEAAGWALADAGMDIHPAKAARAIHQIALDVGIDREDVVDEYVARKLGRADPTLVAIGRHAYEQAEEQHATPYPRAHRTLLDLARRGYALALVTDAPRTRAMRRLQASRLLPFFQEIVTLDDTGTGKRTLDPYLLAAKRLGLPASALAMVGDHPVLDVGQAKTRGWRTVLAGYGLQTRFASGAPEHAPDVTIHWLDELLEILPARRVASTPPWFADETVRALP